MQINLKLEDFGFGQEEEKSGSNFSDYENGTYVIVSKVAYLMGIHKNIFANEFEPPKMEWYEKLEKDKNARIIRNLCRIRAEIERNFSEINKQIIYNLKNIHTLPEYIPQDSLQALSDDGISLVKANQKLPQYIIDINREINNRINNVKPLFPIWLKWEYIRGLYIMPDGLNPNGIKSAAADYYANKRNYPYQVYLNWTGAWDGNILYNDKKFVKMLYEANQDYFTDISKVTDAGNITKSGIYRFLEESNRTAIMVDCENSDPYKLHAALTHLDREALLNKVAKIMLFDDDVYTIPAWRVLEDFTEIPIERVGIQRLKDHKSLVDPILMMRTVKEYYTNNIDSFILLSSDSDYWALIETLPEARYIVMVESEKVGGAIKQALENSGVMYCYIDDFSTGNSSELKKSVVLSEVRRVLESNIVLNINQVLNDAYHITRVELSNAERKQLYDRYIKPMKLVIGPEGELYVRLGD